MPEQSRVEQSRVCTVLVVYLVESMPCPVLFFPLTSPTPLGHSQYIVGYSDQVLPLVYNLFSQLFQRQVWYSTRRCSLVEKKVFYIPVTISITLTSLAANSDIMTSHASGVAPCDDHLRIRNSMQSAPPVAWFVKLQYIRRCIGTQYSDQALG